MESGFVGNVVKFSGGERFYPISFVFNATGELIQACHHNQSAIERLSAAINETDKAIALSALYAAVHPVLMEALRSDKAVLWRGIRYGREDDSPLVDVIVEPVAYGPQGKVFLVMISAAVTERRDPVSGNGEARREGPGEDARQLQEMRERFRRHVAFYKRLVEKARSSYEELQIVSLELNAAKHALRILSEQLSIANVELGSKISDIGNVENALPEVGDLRPIAVLLLDRKLVLRSFSLTADAPFSLTPTDNGKSLAGSLGALPGYDGLLRDIRAVTKSGVARDHELAEGNGATRCVVQILPHRDPTGRLDGGLALFFQYEAGSKA